MSCYTVPNILTKILRGEYPEIVEVTHDPYRGWLEPEYRSLDEARRIISNLAWVLRRAYPANPADSLLIPVSLGLREPLVCNFR